MTTREIRERCCAVPEKARFDDMHFEIQTPYNNDYLWLDISDIDYDKVVIEQENGKKLAIIVEFALFARKIIPNLCDEIDRLKKEKEDQQLAFNFERTKQLELPLR